MPELPKEIWKDRIKNEIKDLKQLNVLKDENIKWMDNVVEIKIQVQGLGFLRNGDDLIPQNKHLIILQINRTFPYPGGIEFGWVTPIFHPNIDPVQPMFTNGAEGTGYICLNILKKWSRLSDLKTTVKALKMLIENPNPDDPLNYPNCLEAADFFRENSIEDLKEKYNIREQKEEEDDIIIIDD